MKKKQFFLMLLGGLFLASCNNSKTKSSANIHEDPVKVVETVFDVAKSGNFSLLTDLCDPTGAGDGDTKRICALSSQSKEIQDDFRQTFEKGKVTGAAEISGDEAKVNIRFGPGGNEEETFKLVRVAGKWYLSGI